MRRFRYWLLRLRLTTTRLTGRMPRMPRQAVRNVLVLWLFLIAATGIAAAIKLRVGSADVLATMAAQQWHATMDKATEVLPLVDDLVPDEWHVGTAALRLALPMGRSSDARQLDGRLPTRRTVRWLVQFITGIDPWNPASILVRELSGVRDVDGSPVEVASPTTWWKTPTSLSSLPSSSSTSSNAPPSSASDRGDGNAPSALESFADSAPSTSPGSAPTDGPVPLPADDPGSGSALEPPIDDERTLPGVEAPPQTDDSDNPLDRLPAVSWGDACRVLIYHTHTSEMYRTDTFAPSSPDEYHVFNTADTGIVRVGRAIKDHLELFGIPTCHLTNVHDWPSHPRAYIEARTTVEQFLRNNPHVDVVLDVHRDAPPGLVAAVGGRRAAQLAFVVGTHPGMHPGWPENVAFSRAMAALIEERFPGLFRRVIERPDSRLNQDLHPRAILVEVGSYDTHLAEALVSAEMLAEIIADMLHIIRFGHSVVDGTGSVR